MFAYVTDTGFIFWTNSFATQDRERSQWLPGMYTLVHVGVYSSNGVHPDSVTQWNCTDTESFVLSLSQTLVVPSANLTLKASFEDGLRTLFEQALTILSTSKSKVGSYWVWRVETLEKINDSSGSHMQLYTILLLWLSFVLLLHLTVQPCLGDRDWVVLALGRLESSWKNLPPFVTRTLWQRLMHLTQPRVPPGRQPQQ